MERSKRVTIAGLFAGLIVCLLVGAAHAHACPVCYGETDLNTSEGISLAVLVLGGVTGGVVAGLASFFMNIRRRTQRAVRRDGPPMRPNSGQ